MAAPTAMYRAVLVVVKNRNLHTLRNSRST
jgi:hypothetical protein